MLKEFQTITKFAFFDLDQTLLDDHGCLPFSFKDDLKKLEKLQVQFAVASTRPYNSIEKLFGELMPRICGTCDNGNVCFSNGRSLVLYPYNLEKVKEFAEQVKIEGDFALVVTGDGVAFADIKDIQRFDKAGILQYLPVMHDINEVKKNHIVISGVNLFCFDNKYLVADKKQALQKKTGEFCLLEAGFGWLSVLPPHIDKSTGAYNLLQQYNLSVDDAICFGDSENDIPMFKLIPHCFAMKNASEYVRSYAYGVTDYDNNSNGALLKAIEYFSLEK